MQWFIFIEMRKWERDRRERIWFFGSFISYERCDNYVNLSLMPFYCRLTPIVPPRDRERDYDMLVRITRNLSNSRRICLFRILCSTSSAHFTYGLHSSASNERSWMGANEIWYSSHCLCPNILHRNKFRKHRLGINTEQPSTFIVQCAVAVLPTCMRAMSIDCIHEKGMLIHQFQSPAISQLPTRTHLVHFDNWQNTKLMRDYVMTTPTRRMFLSKKYVDLEWLTTDVESILPASMM